MKEIEFLSSRYRENMKDLMGQVMFFRAVLENPTPAAYLRQRFPEIVQKVTELLERSDPEILVYSNGGVRGAFICFLTADLRLCRF